MPIIMLRHSSESDRLKKAVESLGYEFSRAWSPGDRRTKTSKVYEHHGFNLCLIDDKETPTNKCVEEAILDIEKLCGELGPLGPSLEGCEMDIGLMGYEDKFNIGVSVTASQCSRLSAAGVNLKKVTLYP